LISPSSSPVVVGVVVDVVEADVLVVDVLEVAVELPVVVVDVLVVCWCFLFFLFFLPGLPF
jgi:hypothetical protein